MFLYISKIRFPSQGWTSRLTKSEMAGIIYLKLYSDVPFTGATVRIADVRSSCWVGGAFWLLRLISTPPSKAPLHVVMVESGSRHGLNLRGVMLKHMRRAWSAAILRSCLELDVECFSGLISDWFNDNYTEDHDCFFAYAHHNVRQLLFPGTSWHGWGARQNISSFPCEVSSSLTCSCLRVWKVQSHGRMFVSRVMTIILDMNEGNCNVADIVLVLISTWWFRG